MNENCMIQLLAIKKSGGHYKAGSTAIQSMRNQKQRM